MDRRNGGDPMAPPRPPKLLPRVHRPRAPEPVIMSEAVVQSTATVTGTGTGSESGTGTIATPQFTNRNQNLFSNHNSNSSQQHSITITAPTTTTLQQHTSNLSNVAVILTYDDYPDYDNYQIHHLTYLPQRPSSLSRNSSQVSNTSNLSTTSSSITAANSFTRRRLPPLPINSAAVPLLNLSGTSSSSNSSGIGGNNFISHFHSNTEPVPGSPVTLAQPRPESERLTNEYVDTPLRTAQQLQHASRSQHPAGQHDNGQTTTHHLLLLPQRELRHQQQQEAHSQHHHQQQQQHSNIRLAGTAGSANATTERTDGTDGFLHSHHSSSNSGQKSPKSMAQTSATTACKHAPPAPARVNGGSSGSFMSSAQPITQPITKQPASSASIAAAAAANSCKCSKDLPTLDDLLELDTIATGIATPQSMLSASNASSQLGTPIIIGGAGVGDSNTSAVNSIMCPRCERCRCEQCSSPRPLPKTWVCNKTCLCSAESVIDYASCLCCAKALFYHCATDNDMDYDDGSGMPCVDNPCSCGPYKRMQRWGWLGALSLVLPCLWCYWPMRGCISLCEKCYGRFAGRGCRCQQNGTSMLPIVPTGDIYGGGGGVVGNGAGSAQNGNGSGQGQGKSVGGGSSHLHHHGECANVASRILRKGDLTPEKRLLDSNPEY